MVTPAHADNPVVAFAGGGSGGHLYPALAIGEALRTLLPNVQLVFLGTQHQIDRQVLASSGDELIPQPLAALNKAPWRWPQILMGFRRSTLLCRSRFALDQPAIVIGTGGLGSVPALREAVRAGIPTALLNPDVIPGRANRFLAGASDVVFVQWEDTVANLRHASRVVVSGCPVRSAFNRTGRADGLNRFDLDPARKTLLVTGASQGARTINRAVLANLDMLESSHSDWQVLHLTGAADHDEVREAYGSRSIRASILPFTDYMAEALAVADLVIARAGASTLAEITAMGRASVLLPYPYHRDQHQLANARCLVRASAARIVRDKIDPAINGPALRQVLEQLLGSADQLRLMATAARRLGRGQAASQIAEHVLLLAEKRGTLNAAVSRESGRDSCVEGAVHESLEPVS